MRFLLIILLITIAIRAELAGVLYIPAVETENDSIAVFNNPIEWGMELYFEGIRDLNYMKWLEFMRTKGYVFLGFEGYSFFVFRKVK